MALLAAYNIAKSYGDRVLFSSVNFELQAKSRTGLVGANGTGKTTLFRLLAGQEQANSGQISLDKNTKIGYMEQHAAFEERDPFMRKRCLIFSVDGRRSCVKSNSTIKLNAKPGIWISL